jgi:hypothetical protein
VRLNAAARGFDGQEERGVRYDDGEEETENPFGDNATPAGKKGENPFGSGARRVEAEEGNGKGQSGSRRSLFNEDI